MFLFHIQIQFSYRISITSAALSVRFVAEEADMEKETVFHEFVSQTQQEFQWKRGIRSLPFNQSSGFHILFDVNGGMSRNVNKVVAAVTNISLSKECFAIGMRWKRSSQTGHSFSLYSIIACTDVASDEPRLWPQSDSSSLTIQGKRVFWYDLSLDHHVLFPFYCVCGSLAAALIVCAVALIAITVILSLLMGERSLTLLSLPVISIKC